MTTLKAPVCLAGGPSDEAGDDKELVHLVRVQLDLIQEGQEGTSHYTRREVATIRRWLERHG